jgi:hypothetical protein
MNATPILARTVPFVTMHSIVFLARASLVIQALGAKSTSMNAPPILVKMVLAVSMD